jgi:predicted acylesterase/phospholipase RssA
MNAVVLSGGGAFGAYEVGVMKALFEGRVSNTRGPLEVGVFTGTSVGAFSSAIMAMQGGTPGGDALARLEQIWLDKIAAIPNGVMRFLPDPLPYLNPLAMAAHPRRALETMVRDSLILAQYGYHRGAAFLSSRRGIASRAVELVALSSLVSVDPLRDTIKNEISIDQIRTSPLALRIAATDWESGECRIFTNPDITCDVILASTSLPGVFPPVQFDNSTFIDGGATMNTPLKPAIEAGADVIHIISLDAHLHAVPAAELDCTFEALLRAFNISVAIAIREDMASAAWINDGIDAFERARRGGELGSKELREFVRVASKLEERARRETGLRKITIHHYHPSENLGGPAALLDFRRPVLSDWMVRGYEDAITHDCRDSGCVLAEPPN